MADKSVKKFFKLARMKMNISRTRRSSLRILIMVEAITNARFLIISEYLINLVSLKI